MAKTKVDYNKLTLDKLVELYKSLSTEDQKKINFSEFMIEVPAKTALVTVVEANGRPKYYIDKNGVTKIKKEKIAVGTEKKKKFSLMKAKRAFYGTYTNEFDWVTKPREKKNNKDDAAKKKRNEALSALGITL